MAMFTLTEKRNLTKLLASVANRADVTEHDSGQREVHTLDGLHGFLFGTAITPMSIDRSEWLPILFGDGGLQFDNNKAGERRLGHLFSASDRITQENRDGVPTFPFSERIKPKEVQRLQDWTRGLYLAISQRPEIWAQRYTEDVKGQESYGDAEITSCISVVMGISDPDKITAFMQRSQGNDSQLVKNSAEFLSRLFVLLPKAVASIQKHANAIRDGLIVPILNRPVGPTEPRRVEKVGRNDPCPCESGLKFKKCCGK